MTRRRPSSSAPDRLSLPTFPDDTSEASIYWDAPAPLAYSTIEMLREPNYNSADELLYLLEAWLRHLGWLWLAEYLNGEDHDPEVDRILFRYILQGKRRLSVGTWAYIGSRLSLLFQQKGWVIQLPHLQRFNYGDPQDSQSALSQLLRYRNNFAHGSFDARLEDILHQRSLLWSLLEPMQSLLTENSLVFWDPEAGAARNANGHWSLQPEVTLPPEPYQLYALRTGKPPVPLSPMLRVSRKEPGDTRHHLYSHLKEVPGWHLHYFDLQRSPHEERRLLFQRNPAVQKSLTTHQRILQGLFDFQPIWDAAQWPESQKNALNSLQAKLQTDLEQTQSNRPNFVQVVGYPGTGKTYLVGNAHQWTSGYHHCVRYRLMLGSPLLSPTTLLRYILRHVLPNNASLGQLPHDELETLWREWLGKLEEHQERMLLAVDQFQLAYRTYQDETLSLYEWLTDLEGSTTQQLSVLLTSRIGYRDDLLHDTLVTLPLADVPLGERYMTSLQELGLLEQAFPTPDTPPRSPEEQRFACALLYVVSATEQPLTVMEAREALSTHQKKHPHLFPSHYVFAPRVAHTLRELRPLLRWDHERTIGQERKYEPFSSSLRTWLCDNLKP